MDQFSWKSQLCAILFSMGFVFACGCDPTRAQSVRKTVAVVNGRGITQEEVDDSVFAQLFALEEQIYALRKSALDNLVARAILEIEAARKKVSVSELKKQLTAGPVEVRPEQVDEAYAEHAQAFGTMSVDEAKERLRLDLESSARMRKYRAALLQLREAAKIELTLEEPRLPPVSFLQAPAQGPENARVTIAEFADFQCPYCRSSQPILRELRKKNPNEVRLVFKHRPLEIHSEAFEASQAAFCAGEQGAFWPFHDALFESEDLLPASITKLATNLHLDLRKFNTCLESNESRIAIQKDLDEARHFGINSTPTFVINGKIVRGALELEQFQAAIEAELKRVAGNKQ